MKSSEAKNLISELTQKINEYSEKYYSTGESGIEDETFDLLMNQLMELERQFPEHITSTSPTQRVGGNAGNQFKNVRHEIQMLSLSNLYNEDELGEWIESVQNRLENETASFECEVKIDGVAISIIYESGEFKQAITRGNGEIGEDVTANIRTIRQLPLALNNPASITVRGEVFLTRQRFDVLNRQKENAGEPLFKNPRNATAGAIRLKEPKAVATRGLSLFIYDVVQGQPSNLHSENLTYLESLSIPVNPYRKKCDTVQEVIDFCNHWESNKADLPFDIDGVVIKIEQLSLRDTLGVTSKSPRWASAWKFKTEKAKTKLISIEDSIGRTGILTPVANLEPVSLLGTEVKRATLYNYDQIQKLDIHQNDTLFVEKGGEIIPKIVGVDYSRRASGAKPILPPAYCPVCGSTLRKGTVEIDLRCQNSVCPAVIEGNLEHFVSKKCMDIQYFGQAMIQLFIKEKLVGSIPDIYRLRDKKERLMDLDGLGEKSIDNLLSAIEASKTVELNRFIHALGIHHIGEKAARSLAIHTETLEQFTKLKPEKLETIVDFGPIMVESVQQWLENQRNQEMVQELVQLGLNPSRLESMSHQPFAGQSCVITGTLTKPRQEWKQRLENVGFNVASSVSKKTSYLLAGEKAGSKLEKAKKLNVPVLSEEEMDAMLVRNDQ